jgi:hypothetical protein
LLEEDTQEYYDEDEEANEDSNGFTNSKEEANSTVLNLMFDLENAEFFTLLDAFGRNGTDDEEMRLISELVGLCHTSRDVPGGKRYIRAEKLLSSTIRNGFNKKEHARLLSEKVIDTYTRASYQSPSS